MTMNDSTTRRTLLRMLGASGLLAGVGAATVTAQDGAENGFGFPETVEFEISTVLETDTVGPPITGTDQGLLFDPSEMAVRGNTLHHHFRFTPGALLVGKAKPYVLTHNGDGTFTSRGQSVNFSVNREEVMQRMGEVEGIPDELAGTLQQLIEPFFQAEEWRAVGRDTISLAGISIGEVWAVTRVDFYTIGTGRPSYTFSLLYTIWAGENSEAEAAEEAALFLDDGRTNLGGQVTSGRQR